MDVAIAVMFALREFLGGSQVLRYMLRDRRASYELSHDTWTRAAKNSSALACLPSREPLRAASTTTPGCATTTGSTSNRSEDPFPRNPAIEETAHAALPRVSENGTGT